MPGLSPSQFEGRGNTSTDYHTGRRTSFFDIDLPDRQPHEPHAVRAKATELGTKSWSVEVVHGPHDTKNEQGSYYEVASRTSIEGKTAGVMAKHVERLARQAALGVVKSRQP